MKKYIDVLKKTQLFISVEEDDIEAMLSCLGATYKEYKKGERRYEIRELIELSYATLVHTQVHACLI